MKGKIQEPAGSQPPGDTSRAKDAAGKGLSKTQMGKLKKELERTGLLWRRCWNVTVSGQRNK